MPDIEDGDSVLIQGSAKDPYVLKNTGGVYSCTCPAWRNQSTGIEARTCKHLRQYRGEETEAARLGGALPERAQRPRQQKVASETAGAPSAQNAGATPAVQKEPGILLAHSWTNDIDLKGW